MDRKTLALTLLVLASGFLFSGAEADDCDQDGDGYDLPGWPCGGDDCKDDPSTDPEICSSSLCDACGQIVCGQCAKCIHPGAQVFADGLDNNCNSMRDEMPVGLRYEGATLQGLAMAIEWYELNQTQYVYVGAGGFLQVLKVDGQDGLQKIQEIPLRDFLKEMTVVEHPAGTTLFVAARGDGLLAFDVLSEPPRSGELELADSVTGLFDVDGHTGVEAVFNGVDAKWDVQRQRIVVAGVLPGAVPAATFNYDPQAPVSQRFSPDQAFLVTGTAFAPALTADAGGLYIGCFNGSLYHVDMGNPDGTPLSLTGFGAIWDIETQGDVAFVAGGGSLFFPSKLSRVTVESEQLIRIRLANPPGDPGGFLDIDGDRLAFSLTGANIAAKDNLYLYRLQTLLDYSAGSSATPPDPLSQALTMDWIFDVAVRDRGTGSDWVFVADEWGGVQMWEDAGAGLVLPCANQSCYETGGNPRYDFQGRRLPTGAALTGEVWVGEDPTSENVRVFAVQGGAGLWYFDESDPDDAQVAVEWLDPADPACDPSHADHCDDCSCPKGYPEDDIAKPYPPAVFVTTGMSHADEESTVFLMGVDRNDSAGYPDRSYFMGFRWDAAGGRYECTYSEPVYQCGNALTSDGNILFVTATARGTTTGYDKVRMYQNCDNQVSLLGEIQAGMTYDFTPPPSLFGRYLGNLFGADVGIRSMATYGDYLFVAETISTGQGMVSIYRWKHGEVTGCPATNLLFPMEPLLVFLTDKLPHALYVDIARKRLFAGCGSKNTFPPVSGALLSFDLSAFDADPVDARSFLDSREDISAQTLVSIHGWGEMATYSPSIRDIAGDATNLYIADIDNGLFVYSMDENAYAGFYPPGAASAANVINPSLVLADPGVLPVNRPVSVAVAPTTGKILVHEHTLARVAMLSFGMHADASNTAGPHDGTRENPYQHIQDAVDETGYGGAVFVAGGRYPEQVELGHGVRLFGGYDRETWVRDISVHQSTIAGSAGYTITAAEGTRIDGFTINGHDGIDASNSSPEIWNNTIQVEQVGLLVSNSAHPVVGTNSFLDNTSGNGIECWMNAHPMILANTIMGNAFDGIHIRQNAYPTVTNNTILFNGNAGLASLDDSFPTLQNNLVVGNAVNGMRIGNNSSPLISNNTIYSNAYAGIDTLDSSSPRIQNNIIMANWKGIRCGASASPSIQNNDVYENSTSNFVGCPAAGNIQVNPLFVNAPGFDFHLDLASPCIDTGTDTAAPSFDFDWLFRPVDIPGVGNDGINTTDMGIFEYGVVRSNGPRRPSGRVAP